MDGKAQAGMEGKVKAFGNDLLSAGARLDRGRKQPNAVEKISVILSDSEGAAAPHLRYTRITLLILADL